MAGVPNNSFSDERLRVFKQVLLENNVTFEPKRIYYGYFWETPTMEAMDKMLEDEDELPEAIICANDMMAITVCDILVEKGESILFIDQHAGHERLLYDKFVEEQKNKQVAIQPLLIPFVLETNYIESSYIDENIDVIKELGFEISEFGENSFKISTVPSSKITITAPPDMNWTLDGELEAGRGQVVINNLHHVIRLMNRRSGT